MLNINLGTLYMIDLDDQLYSKGERTEAQENLEK